MEDMYRKFEVVGENYFFVNIAVLLAQYMVSFGHLPFDSIYNRPPIDVIASCFGIIDSVVCCLLITYCAEIVPTSLSLSLNYLTLGLETFSASLYFAAAFAIFQTNPPLYYKSNPGNQANGTVTVYVTKYFQIVSSFSFILSLVPIILLATQTKKAAWVLQKNTLRIRHINALKPNLSSIGSTDSFVELSTLKKDDGKTSQFSVQVLENAPDSMV